MKAARGSRSCINGEAGWCSSLADLCTFISRKVIDHERGALGPWPNASDLNISYSYPQFHYSLYAYNLAFSLPSFLSASLCFFKLSTIPQAHSP
jgi:hypothetical protein